MEWPEENQLAKYEYSPGDRVVIRGDLDSSKCYYGMLDPYVSNTVTTEMERLRGCTVTILDRISGQYMIEEDPDRWYWVDSMFEGYAEPEQMEESDFPLDEFLMRK